MLQGNFQGFPTIYDPSTAGPNKVKQPYPNNVIPASQFGPFAANSKDKVYGRLTYDLTDDTVAIPQPGDNRIYPLHSWRAVLAWSHVFSLSACRTSA